MRFDLWKCVVMGERHIVELCDVAADELAPFLTARSGLPGPRGNLELATLLPPSLTVPRFFASWNSMTSTCGSAVLKRSAVSSSRSRTMPRFAR